MTPLRYVLEAENGAVVLTEGVIETLLQHRQKNLFAKEAGGQLFARFEGADTIIVEATHPKPSDKRSRFSFRPDRITQQLDIARRYAEELHFVGDWHTHPQSVPNPSSIDISSMIECFRRSRHDLKAFLLIVVGTAAPHQGFYVGLVREGSVREMTLLPQNRTIAQTG